MFLEGGTEWFRLFFKSKILLVKYKFTYCDCDAVNALKGTITSDHRQISVNIVGLLNIF